jgi:hypothetical protein
LRCRKSRTSMHSIARESSVLPPSLARHAPLCTRPRVTLDGRCTTIMVELPRRRDAHHSPKARPGFYGCRQ